MPTTHEFRTPDGVAEINETNSSLTDLFGLARWVATYSYGAAILDGRGGVRFADLCTAGPTTGPVTSLRLVVDDDRIEANVRWPGLFDRKTYIRLDSDADTLLDTLERYLPPARVAHVMATVVTSADPAAMVTGLGEVVPTVAELGPDPWEFFTAALQVVADTDGDLDAIRRVRAITAGAMARVH